MMNKYIVNLEDYAAAARNAAAEGCVLLKNDKEALPIRKGEKIAVFGRGQLNYYKSGTGSGGMVNTKYVISILDALSKEEVLLDKTLLETYRTWVKEHPKDLGKGWAGEPWSQSEMPLDKELIEEAAARNDLAVVIISRTAGEDQDNSNTQGSYLLTQAEEAMLQGVCKIFKRTVVVLNVGNIIDMSWVEPCGPEAIVYVWHGGQEGGHAAADVLLGRHNPSGKLTDTIAKKIEDYPSTANFGSQKKNVYVEDIFVGYRYFETFAKDKVMYPFGFGLSYTTFDIHYEGTDSNQGDTLVFKVSVINTGAISGKEVVQVYVNPPQGKLGKPIRNLVGFAKTSLLEPGEKTQLEIIVPYEALASFDDSGVTGQVNAFVMEAGKYDFYLGSDVRTSNYCHTFELEELILVEKLEEALAPIESFDRMTPISLDGSLQVEYIPVPTRKINVKDRIEKALPSHSKEATLDSEYVLGDVLDGRIHMETFLDQLSDEDLIHLSRGEGMSSPKVTPGTAGAFGGLTERLKAFGIPAGCAADGPSGIRMDCGSTAFSLPNGTCLASSFNEDIVFQLYQMVGKELRKNQVDTLLGPGLNIHRNPLNGRNFEYFSEDPLLTGKMGVACLLGMEEYGVYGTIKHFIANNQEKGRHKYDSVVSQRALREIYLKGFEIAVKEGKAKSVMTAYNAVNGVWTAGSYDLNTTILRNQWGFDGIVMTDWWASMNDEDGGEASNQNTHYMVRAQNDLFMVTPDTEQNASNDLLADGLRDGVISRDTLLRNGANICKFLMHTPAMERFLGRTSEEELEARNSIDKDEMIYFDMEYQLVDKEAKLPLEDLDTAKGGTNVFALTVKDKGFYDLKLKLRAQGGDLAQLPLTISMDNRIITTITLKGSENQWIEKTVDIGLIFGNNAYLKIFFAQGGMEIEDMTVSLREVFDMETFRAMMAD